MMPAKIIIAGAGIGGLTTALCLHRAGLDVEIYESANEIKALGVGLNILPHAVRVLAHLGLQDTMYANAIVTSELVYLNKFGKSIWQEPRGEFAGYHWPQFSIHRGEFQMLLLEETTKRLGPHKIHTGHCLQHARNSGNGVQATFIDRKTNETIATIHADALVAADGIHSAARKQFYPDEGLPKFSGILLHRGVTIAKPFLSGSSMIMAGSADKKFVAYPIKNAVDDDGNQLINFVADLRVDPGDNILPQDWNRKADKLKLLQEFSSWKFNWLDIPGLIRHAQAIYEFPMSDRDPLPQWSFGNITLLGDAAHPMYPIGSNGASQAILDAECVMECLSDAEDIASAFKKYESLRLPATANIVLQNRQMGPEKVMQIVEERAPDGFNHIHDIISQQELETIVNGYKKIAGFDREELNQKK